MLNFLYDLAASTHDQDIFSFYPDERPCNGFSEALERYKELVPHLRLAGTSAAVNYFWHMFSLPPCTARYGQYVPVRWFTGTQTALYQVVRTTDPYLSLILLCCSEFPLSIVLVGVGDGPWDMMKEFDDNIPSRAFDNFQRPSSSAFSVHVLISLLLNSRRSAKSPERVPLPPPVGGYDRNSVGSNSFKSTSFQQSAPSYSGYETASALASTSASSTTPSAPSSSYDNQVHSQRDMTFCSLQYLIVLKSHLIILFADKSFISLLADLSDLSYKPQGYGFWLWASVGLHYVSSLHQTCCECGPSLQTCPICRSEIHTRIKLF
ncbi:hypothetical protein GW17_00006665 [Ensete ventricosum]|nr:hypothetical protein GW17_00006665 [Ensete ventricosum]